MQNCFPETKWAGSQEIVLTPVDAYLFSLTSLFIELRTPVPGILRVIAMLRQLTVLSANSSFWFLTLEKSGSIMPRISL